METSLIPGTTLAAFDADVLTAVADETDPYGGGGHDCRVAVRNEAGAIYRLIVATGMGEFMGIVGALEDIGLTDEIAGIDNPDYDAIFGPG